MGALQELPLTLGELLDSWDGTEYNPWFVSRNCREDKICRLHKK
jgi:hypothetical protein